MRFTKIYVTLASCACGGKQQCPVWNRMASYAPCTSAFASRSTTHSYPPCARLYHARTRIPAVILLKVYLCGDFYLVCTRRLRNNEILILLSCRSWENIPGIFHESSPLPAWTMYTRAVPTYDILSLFPWTSLLSSLSVLFSLTLAP